MQTLYNFQYCVLSLLWASKGYGSGPNSVLIQPAQSGTGITIILAPPALSSLSGIHRMQGGEGWREAKRKEFLKSSAVTLCVHRRQSSVGWVMPSCLIISKSELFLVEARYISFHVVSERLVWKNVNRIVIIRVDISIHYSRCALHRVIRLLLIFIISLFASIS